MYVHQYYSSSSFNVVAVNTKETSVIKFSMKNKIQIIT